jgi:hypothetical protein
VASALPLALFSLGVSVIVIGLVLFIERRAQHTLRIVPDRWGLAGRKQKL